MLEFRNHLHHCNILLDTEINFFKLGEYDQVEKDFLDTAGIVQVLFVVYTGMKPEVFAAATQSALYFIVRVRFCNFCRVQILLANIELRVDLYENVSFLSVETWLVVTSLNELVFAV